MDFLQTFIEGYNVIFTVPVLFVVLFVLMQVVGFNLDHLVGAGADADVDADVDVGLDADAGVDVDAGLDADAGVDVDADADMDVDGHVGMEGAGHGVFIDAMAFFNLGKVPMMIVVEILFITFGMTGVIFNFYGVEKLPFYESWMRMGVSIPLAAIVALLVTKTLTELMAAYIPTSGKQALKARDLEGRIGEVVSVRLDEKYGRVVVNDPTGQVHMVHCMMMEKEPAVLKGGRVVLVSYDQKNNTYQCSAASQHSA